MTTRRVPDVAPIPVSAGMGLRFPHHSHVLASRPTVSWFEVHAENYLVDGRPLEILTELRADYPISLHAVGMSLGGADLPDETHLARLSRLVERIEPGLLSDHLSWSAVGGEYLADLLPLPYTEEALAIVARNIDAAQTALRRRLLVENPARYIAFTHSTLSEAEFLGELARRTGCGLLCDVNNIHVSASNLGLDASRCLDAFPRAGVGEIHLAGFTSMALPSGAEALIDSHGTPVSLDVWRLYERALARFGPVPTLIERDTDIPSFETLQAETLRAQSCIDRALTGQSHDHAA